MNEAKPFPKDAQLARAERRYRRKVASPKQWQAIYEAKKGPCRVCFKRGTIQMHHLVSRQDGGDDVADNIVPICPEDHDALTRRVPAISRLLLGHLSDAEYGYMVERGGTDYLRRAYGIEYARG